MRRFTTDIKNGFIGTVGKTPLIRLKHLSSQFKCEILAKAEWLNPGGSVKDRAAYFMVQKAEASGKLKPGGTIVEGTAGNTGVGLAHICRAKGYQCVIFMPDTQSKEKIDLLRMLGATVYTVPVVPFENPKNYNHLARLYAESIDGLWTNQFDNLDNRLGHYESTGPEIWNQTGGNIDAFVCSTGTGGTLSGVTAYLKEKNNHIKCYLADPPGSCLYDFITSNGKSMNRQGSSITEGIGQGRITKNLEQDWKSLDGAVFIPDEETIKMVFRLLDEEGIYVGASSALNIVAAGKVAEIIGPGKTVVSILCDGAYRYQSRLFSRQWLESKGLLKCVPGHHQKYISLP